MLKVSDTAPLATPRGKVDWTQVAAVAKRNPGKWVEVPTPLSRGMTTQIKRGQVRAIDPDKFDITSRAITGTKQVTFYVRFRGAE